ncbi:hypothetical protein XM38_034020 [Halomicronema hongdechloris C2206]|uniref:NB-ARC domain-containing protein n=1 Tax=Halomicronema hongdechloris C2206 TaxID=1641165 RepID=A0A1Z3HQ74_9CYAN|nr:NB-ARC domain-containing protein [Halomicronema hongdechloris]ASC72445.1 hypothetical protein XM38_034020 [Halomicronema hongdechloris C2206]
MTAAPLSPDDRRRLLQTLNGLPSTQQEEIIFALNPPTSVLASNTGTPGHRVITLLTWAEGPTGCGLAAVIEQLNQCLGAAQRPAFKLAQRWMGLAARNRFFTGREPLLMAIHTALQTYRRVVFSGIGGIGKTQTALEYAYRHRHEYDYGFWVRAASKDELFSGYSALAEALQLPGRQQVEQSVVVNLVTEWLAHHDRWLLVLDNADDLKQLQPFLPVGDRGHLLLTSRAQAVGTLAHRLEIKTMAPAEGALFLLRRAKLLPADAPLMQASTSDQTLAHTLQAEMDGLPLALDQAGAYMEEQVLSLWEYLQQFREEKAHLLSQRGDLASDHPSVTVTFSLAFQKVLAANPADLWSHAAPGPGSHRAQFHLCHRVHRCRLPAESDRLLSP